MSHPNGQRTGEPVRSQSPPSRDNPVRVMHASVNHRLIGAALAAHPTGYLCHWTGRYNLVCLGANCCGGCQRKWPIKWVAYLPMCSPRTLKVFVAAIPEHTFLACSELHPEGPSILGRVVTLYVPSQAVPYHRAAEVSTICLPVDRLPAPPNLDDVLLGLWERFGRAELKGGEA